MSEFSLNHFVVEARISRVIEVKYSPSGVPIVVLLLNQVSQQQENGHNRQVTLNLLSKYLGEKALFWTQQANKKVRASGFLQTAKLGFKNVVFHITDIELSK